MFSIFGKKAPQHSPQEAGFIIAGGLHRGCTKQMFTSEQRDLMQEAELPSDIFWREVLCLAGFSAGWFIMQVLREEPIREAVRAGYFHAWDRFAAESPENRRVFDALPGRAMKYTEAASEELARPVGVWGDPISEAFSECVVEAAGIKAGSLPQPSSSDLSVAVKNLGDGDRRAFARLGRIDMLAALTARPVFDSAQQICGQVLTEAKIITRRADR